MPQIVLAAGLMEGHLGPGRELVVPFCLGNAFRAVVCCTCWQNVHLSSVSRCDEPEKNIKYHELQQWKEASIRMV